MAAVALAAVAVALALVFDGHASSNTKDAETSRVPGEPSVEVISPRNGARQTARAAVVKVHVENFQLAPNQFGAEPQLGEGPAHFQAARFFAVSLASLGLNIAVLELLVSNHVTGELVAQAIAVAVAMPFNFLGNKLWAFD